MAERKLERKELGWYCDDLGQRYASDVMLGVQQGWFRIPAANTKTELREAIEDIHWQRFRGQRLKGQTTEWKLELLHWYLCIHEGTDYEQKAFLQVMNYLDALKRGGFLIEVRDDFKPSKTMTIECFGNKRWVIAK